MKEHAKKQLLFFLLLLLLVTAAALLLRAMASYTGKEAAPVQTEVKIPYAKIVLDAGHGGEDGGAVSKSGLLEKDLNLALCKQLSSMLRINGVEVIETRTEDELLYDKTVDYEGRKKALDLAARKSTAQKHPTALFVSIHMNAYPLPQYEGLQVWYSPNHASSREVAQKIQQAVVLYLQPQNERRIKQAGSTIYLLHQLQSPAVLVECGFLSNESEAERLGDEEYRKKLAFLLTLALMDANDGLE